MASINDIKQKFDELNDRLLKDLDFFDHLRVKSRDFSTEPDFIQSLSKDIQAGREQMPVVSPRGIDPTVYREGYIDPLIKNLGSIIQTLKPYDTDPEDDNKACGYLTLLVNAALQPAQDDVKKFLCPVQALANDLYGSFLEKRNEVGLKSPLDQACPPLIGFVAPPLSFDRRDLSGRAPMPSTFELVQMREADWLDQYGADFKVGPVLLPAGYMDNPLLWGVLGHEVGGHYVLTSDKAGKLLPQLESTVYDKVYDEMQSKKYRYAAEVAALWLYWAEEAAADVCGVLNLGPSFGIGAVSWYTAQAYRGKWGNKGELNGVFSPTNQHPIAVLIPHVIRGAVEGLKKLGQSRKVRYIAQLEEIGELYTKVDVLTFKGSKVWDNQGNDVKLPDTLPLKDMQESAHFVGHLIATVTLSELAGHDLQDLTACWTEDDEEKAINVSKILENGATPRNGKDGNNVQLIGGGLLAVIRQPRLYKPVNDLLGKSFQCK